MCTDNKSGIDEIHPIVHTYNYIVVRDALFFSHVVGWQALSPNGINEASYFAGSIHYVHCIQRGPVNFFDHLDKSPAVGRMLDCSSEMEEIKS